MPEALEGKNQEMKSPDVTPPMLLSPYAHRLAGHGRACAEDCPACRWAEEFSLMQSRTAGRNPRK
jgi:hypothetical protein